MNTILLALFSLLVAGNVHGQLAVGSTAPDFTMTDLNGVEHNLYELLDDGKTVVIDVMAAWCSNCWNFHNNGVLETIWDDYGPGGTDEIYVFLIDGDANTTDAQVQGIGGGTIGDWTEGTLYPVINAPNSDFATDFAIPGFPTIYTICSDRIVVDNSSWQSYSVAGILESDQSCPGCAADIDGNGGVDVADFLMINSDFGAPCPGCATDLDGDGVVGINDFILFNSEFGSSCN